MAMTRERHKVNPKPIFCLMAIRTLQRRQQGILATRRSETMSKMVEVVVIFVARALVPGPEHLAINLNVSV